MNNPQAAPASLHNVLAPASSPAHPVSLAHYATQTWGHGGIWLGLILIAVLIVAWKMLPSGPRFGKARNK